MKEEKQKPTLGAILQLSGVDLIHPGGFDITKRIGEIVDMKGKTILDVACGSGTLPCYYAGNFGAKVVGVDLDPGMIKSSIEKAKKEGVEDLTEFRVADALALPFEDNSFDAAISECAVTLTSDHQKCLDEMARVTKPGGNVVIHENTWLKEISEAEKAEKAGKLGGAPHTLSEWKGMMEKAGLTGLRTEDWSGLENVYKIRHDRKMRNLDDIFSLREKMFIVFPKMISMYGLKGISYYKSAQKTNPLHFYVDGTLGYFLIRGEKSL
ncbi:demethylrebeccamycin-D-glucose O-methyltransferase [bacterium BMS3Abin06]|nr:demethylrebeccamycin-D-glucose O-methyltransferase [bacterium BMS3Abin06]